MKKFAVILSGCGVYDGSEIHEAVMTLLAIDKAGASYGIFAPDIKQYHVINHLTGEEMNETRNVLVESARIARGKIKPLSEYKAADYDGLVLPGGLGASKNLSDYAFKSDKMTVLKEVEKAVLETHKAGKPIGALCIAPVIIAKIINNAVVTIGCDSKIASHIKNMGAIHQDKGKGEVAIDKKNKIVTSPCYMLTNSIKDIATGAEATVTAMLEMMND